VYIPARRLSEIVLFLWNFFFTINIIRNQHLTSIFSLRQGGTPPITAHFSHLIHRGGEWGKKPRPKLRFPILDLVRVLAGICEMTLVDTLFRRIEFSVVCGGGGGVYRQVALCLAALYSTTEPRINLHMASIIIKYLWERRM
jgi:hypothetical protein